METANFKFGCNAPPLAYPKLFLSRFMAASLPAPPTSATFADRIAKWPMMMNDTYGDCVVAMKGHFAQIASLYGGGTEVVIPDATIKSDYFTETGGRDNGLNIDQSLDYWVAHGLGGEALSAWGAINPQDPVEISQTIAWFGGCGFGVNLPSNCMDAINRKQPWTDTSYPPNRNMGHAILGAMYEPDGPTVITWGQKQKCSWAWIEKYATNAYALISPKWMQHVVTPGGLDLASFLSAFTALSNKKPPIIQNPPPIDWLV